MTFKYPHGTWIGFDRLWSELERGHGLFPSQSQNFPPHNIIRFGEDKFVIEMAVAGYRLEDLKVEQKRDILTVSGSSPRVLGDEDEYLHKGISDKKFEKSFKLHEYVDLKGCDLLNGMLRISLQVVVPEKDRVRIHEIGYGDEDRFNNPQVLLEERG